MEEKVKLELLDDDAIMDYTATRDGIERVITDSRDFNLRNKPFQIYTGGLYDAMIFGSPYKDQCSCGYVRSVSREPCPNCGTRVYSKEEALRQFARVELPFYYLNSFRFPLFLDWFERTFEKNCKIVHNFVNPDLRASGYTDGRSSKRLGIKVFDSCQFEYDPKKKVLLISEYINDESKCSYEGLLKICNEHFPDQVPSLLKLINRLYLILPTALRPPSFVRKGSKSVLGTNRLNVWYRMVLTFCCAENLEAKSQNYDVVMEALDTPGERVRYTALLRAMLNVGISEATSLLRESKKNLARDLLNTNVDNSARAVITPSTTLKIDEIEVPTHLAYEMCRSDFVKHLMEKMNLTKSEAIRSSVEEYDNPEIQKLFKEYAETRTVLYCMIRRVKAPLGEISPRIFENCGNRLIH